MTASAARPEDVWRSVYGHPGIDPLSDLKSGKQRPRARHSCAIKLHVNFVQHEHRLLAETFEAQDTVCHGALSGAPGGGGLLR